MALEDDCVGLQQIAAVITAEAELCALISSEVNGAWNNELQQLTAVTMAAGIAQAYQLVRVPCSWKPSGLNRRPHWSADPL